jgi:hypothetical protein
LAGLHRTLRPDEKSSPARAGHPAEGLAKPEAPSRIYCRTAATRRASVAVNPGDAEPATALAVRGERSWRPIGVVSLAATTLLVVSLSLPWSNAPVLSAIITLFGWIAALAARLTTQHA